jgi:membrane protease subunit HflK
MAWNDGNNGNDNDPWRPRGSQGPADLDAIVRDLQRKLAGFFGGGRGKRGGDDIGPGGRGEGPKVGSGLAAFLVVLGAIIWAGTGFYIVDEAERAIVLRFGKHVDITNPGLRWHLPAPIERAVTINTNQVVEKQYSGSMLTRDENIVRINLEVQYVRTDPEAYLFNMVNPEETLEEVTASAIREIVGKNDLAYIITAGRLDIADQALQLIQSTLDLYGTGITVIQLPMDEAQYPDAVQASVQDVVKAREDRERAVADATTYNNQILPEAEGRAVRQLRDAEGYQEQVIADAQGQSQRFTQIMTEYQRAPEVTQERIFIETMEIIMANSTKVLVDTEGGTQLLYLPLDQLVQRQTDAEAQQQSSQSSAASPAAAQSASGAANSPSGARR